ncbi:hypothetical protein PSCICN_43680 [Pseudomonas cichorii]|uniref:hypothetical protein n=1 Tax=Pseudomonas cichorii TaxID=36746 RepID=UPI001910096E|nr:hypothetical protein [Pseudomonas cichorii]GFM83676.1 hypothetical protein PSCICN_43680 [Pseudomonas cichorii]
MFKRMNKAISSVLFMGLSAWGKIAECKTTEEGFYEQTQVTSHLNYWQRTRHEWDATAQNSDVKSTLKQAVLAQHIDITSGYALNTLGLDIGLFSSAPLTASQGSIHPNTMGLSQEKQLSEERYSGDRAGWSYYKAAGKWRSGPFWARLGYLQPHGQGLLATNWSFVPGTYRGLEAGVKLPQPSGVLEMSYFWSDQYKAPWYTKTDSFLQGDGRTRIHYLHTLGLKYQDEKDYSVEAAWGQAQGYRQQFFFKVSRPVNITLMPALMTYQFYAARDQKQEDAQYTDLAWLQALTIGSTQGSLGWRIEATSVKAEGSMGYFTPRMTPAYGSSNGRMDIGWDSRSDFNAHGERALYTGITYKLSKEERGLTVGIAHTYAWNARPAGSIDIQQQTSLTEQAWRYSIAYKLRTGSDSYTQFDFRHIRYRNSANGSPQQSGYSSIPLKSNESILSVSVPLKFL